MVILGCKSFPLQFIPTIFILVVLQNILQGSLNLLTIQYAEIVRDDPTNNVPDNIFSKLGMQLHRRDQHPLGILKNAIYDYFDTNYPNKFDKFDDLCPIVSVTAVWLVA